MKETSWTRIIFGIIGLVLTLFYVICGIIQINSWIDVSASRQNIQENLTVVALIDSQLGQVTNSGTIKLLQLQRETAVADSCIAAGKLKRSNLNPIQAGFIEINCPIGVIL